MVDLRRMADIDRVDVEDRKPVDTRQKPTMTWDKIVAERKKSMERMYGKPAPELPVTPWKPKGRKANAVQK